MNTKPIFRVFLAVLTVCTLLLSSCGETPAPASENSKDFSTVDMTAAALDVQGLAEHLLQNVAFDDPHLILMDSAIAETLYNIAGLAESAVSYGSTGATAEAILVLKCASPENAEAAKAKIDQYRTEMADVYADYNEPESGKLTNALLSADGVYVVFCVSPDAKAAENVYHTFVTEAVYGAEG
ncbi:MAG: DUF4358 domain-containing protein [Clostridia bacterium]|nr:DUF4358 domain-containing protein [Clostridia bacterium]